LGRERNGAQSAERRQRELINGKNGQRGHSQGNKRSRRNTNSDFQEILAWRCMGPLWRGGQFESPTFFPPSQYTMDKREEALGYGLETKEHLDKDAASKSSGKQVRAQDETGNLEGEDKAAFFGLAK